MTPPTLSRLPYRNSTRSHRAFAGPHAIILARSRATLANPCQPHVYRKEEEHFEYPADRTQSVLWCLMSHMNFILARIATRKTTEMTYGKAADKV